MDDWISKIDGNKAALAIAVKTLWRYRDCPHGGIRCFCTKEARHALRQVGFDPDAGRLQDNDPS